MTMRFRGTALTALLLACFLPGCVGSSDGRFTGGLAGGVDERPLGVKQGAGTRDAATMEASKGLRLARILCSQGRYEGALDIYARLDAGGRLSPQELLEYAGVASFVQPPRQTMRLFMRVEKALASQHNSVAPATLAALHTGLGRAYMDIGQPEAARQHLRQALEAAPEDVAALNALGVLLDSEGEHDEARVLLRRASALQPEDARILNNLALSYLSGGETGEARSLFRQAANLSDNPSIVLNLAFVQFWDGRTTEARSGLRGVMNEKQADSFLSMFQQMADRARQGESTIAEELLMAAGKLMDIAPPTERSREYSVEDVSGGRGAVSASGTNSVSAAASSGERAAVSSEQETTVLTTVN